MNLGAVAYGIAQAVAQAATAAAPEGYNAEVISVEMIPGADAVRIILRVVGAKPLCESARVTDQSESI